MLDNALIKDVTIVVVMGQCIINTRETEVRIVREKLFWGLSVMQYVDRNDSYGDACLFNTQTVTVDSVQQKLALCRWTLEQIQPGCAVPRTRKKKGRTTVQLILGHYTSVIMAVGLVQWRSGSFVNT